MHIMRWKEVCYETLDYESELLLFHEIYCKKKFFNWNKYTSNGIWFYYLLSRYLIFYLAFPIEPLTCTVYWVTAQPVSANN